MTTEFLDGDVTALMKECKTNEFGAHEGGKRVIVDFYEWVKKERFKNWIRGLYGGFDRRRWMWVGRMAICMVVGGRGGSLCAKCRRCCVRWISFFESLT